MRNQEIAAIFTKMGTLLEIKGENVFKVKAYYRAADNIAALGEDIAQISEQGRLAQVEGIGQALEAKIKEYLATGKVQAYAELISQVPETLLDVVEIPSVGPKKAKLFFEELKIKNIQDLKTAAEKGSLLKLEGIREKTVDNILRGLRVVAEGQARMNLGTATQTAESFLMLLKDFPEVKEISVAGSLRRGKETIGDIDILVASSDHAKVMDRFVKLPTVKSVVARGDTKASVLTENNLQVDLRVVDPDCFGAALLYFTGSKNFNIRLRQIAIKKKMKISEYGVFSVKGKSEVCLASKTEKECFKALGLGLVPPELREEIGEAELFAQNKVPPLIEIKDIKGDLHTHSTWSDGKNTIAEMAQAARQRGYEYIALSDHSERLKIAGGVSAADLVKKKKEIDALNKKYKDFRILFGCELEIDSEGNLDYNERILAEFDIVIAAIHSGFEQSKEKLTARLFKAIQSKYVNVIAHPTGVHLGKREPYDIDLKTVCQAAADHNVFLEINAFPIRLDLNSTNIYYARSLGSKFSINTDAHRLEHLEHMKYGVTLARRGWLKSEDVLNTLSHKELMKTLAK